MTTLAEVLVMFVLRVVVPTVAVSVISVPAEAPAATVIFTVKVLVEPTAMAGLVQLTVPVVVQVHPAAGVSEVNVVLVGNGSVKVAVLQLLGPVLVTTCV
jgi:hypothetical protein